MNPVAGGRSDARLVRHSLVIANEVAVLPLVQSTLPVTVGHDGGLNTCALSGGCCAASGSAWRTILCVMECRHFTINLC